MTRVAWHLSHHSRLRPDGWSGAPDEARWIREDLTPRVQLACARRGIFLVLIDGDLMDHIEFHEDYAAFAAPHYEANVHGEGGWFWGRAAQSSTGAEDDRLGAIFERNYRQLPGVPPWRPNWNNSNVTDYYGFRLTTPRTPGILVEHGVGAPGAPDHDWLRQNAVVIAEMWARTLAEFTGGKQVTAPRLVGQTPEHDIDIAVGQVAMLTAEYEYPGGGPARAVIRKVWAQKPGRYVYSIRPPVDPDGDETEHLEHESEAVFVVDVVTP